MLCSVTYMSQLHVHKCYIFVTLLNKLCLVSEIESHPSLIWCAVLHICSNYTFYGSLPWFLIFDTFIKKSKCYIYVELCHWIKKSKSKFGAKNIYLIIWTKILVWAMCELSCIHITMYSYDWEVRMWNDQAWICFIASLLKIA